MNPLLQVSEQDIEHLNKYQLPDIMNRLLKAEARRYGIPPLCVKTTLRIDDPDGGVDARVEHSVGLPTVSRIPGGLSVWQYKAGDVTPRKIREVESQKPGVQEAIQSGGSYCFVMGKGCADPKRRKLEEAVNHCYVEKGLVPKGRLFTAQDIADWVSDHPAVAIHPYFNRPIHDDLLIFDSWRSSPELRAEYVDFEVDGGRQDVIDYIRQVSVNRAGFESVRIAGRAGVGKTRLVLEAIRANGLEYETMYARSPEGVPSVLFSHIEVNANIRHLTLVVDECTSEQATRLWQRAERCGNRLLLITIEHEPTAPGVETVAPLFWLDTLGDDIIRRIVQKIAPTMPLEMVSFVVKASSGYVKLATALAEALAHNPGLIGAAQLTGIPEVRVILETLVPAATDRRAMEALSLLRRVGMDGEVAAEGQTVADFIGIDFRELKRVAEQMRQSGLVVKRGRYRYVTPHLLAVWFATDVWRAWGDDIVTNLLLAETGLPNYASKMALLERLADLGEEEIAAPVAEALLGPDGLFPGIEELDDSLRSQLFAILAKAAPKAGTAALERVLVHLPRDRLLRFRRGRRQVVWTLERLLYLRDTFWPAARLLLQLAEAENETILNNATGTWREIFYTRLSGTPIPAVERHRLIEEALGSSRVETRLLAVQAIQAALSTYESQTRGSGVGGHIIPVEWRPKTWGEVWEARRSALRLLDRALADPEPQVVEAARGVLFATARGLAGERLADEILPRLQNLPLRSDSECQAMRELLQDLLRYEGEVLTEEQRQCVEQWANDLAGDSFHDRLRRWVGAVSFPDREELSDAGKTPEEMAASMADEGYRDPDALRPELKWLASADAMHFYFFGRRLGQLDSDHTWLEDLLTQIRNGGNPGLLTAYLHGRTDSGEGEWVEQLLDEWAQNDESLAPAAFDATWRRGGSDEGGVRIISMVDKGWISPAALGTLAWGGWVDPLSASTMASLMQRIIRDEGPQATEGALLLVLRWLKAQPQQVEGMAEYALELLERPCALVSRGMFLFYWQQVARVYIPRFPARIARTILSLFTDTDYLVTSQDDRMAVLREALHGNPEEVWPLIGKVLLREDEVGYRLFLAMRTWAVEAAGVALLLAWAETHKPKGVWVLAELASVGGDPLYSLPRELLIRYGQDERVGHALGASFLSGSWVGSQADWLRAKLDVARGWLRDEDASVRSWVQEVVRELEAGIKRVQQQEEEGELWY